MTNTRVRARMIAVITLGLYSLITLVKLEQVSSYLQFFSFTAAEVFSFLLLLQFLFFTAAFTTMHMYK